MAIHLRQIVVMKSMLFPSIAAGALCLVASSASLSAAETDSHAVFKSLEDSINGLMDVDDLPNAMVFWKHMEISADRLRKYSTHHLVPEEYAQSIKGLSEALTRVVQDKGLSPQGKTTICAAVEKDLEIKVAFAKRKLSAPFGNIVLAAKTTDRGKEISECEVWYVPVAWEGTKGRHLRFPELSSPTSKALPPGYYSMWTRKGVRDGEQKPVIVEKDSAKQDVDLPAPTG
jgi:hypothetical protein